MQNEENQAIESDVVVAGQPIQEQAPEEVVTEEVVEQVDESPEEETEEEQEESTEDIDDSKDVEESDDDERFPKKAERALERRNKKINKLRAENAELQQQLAEYKANPPQPREQVGDDFIPEGLEAPREEDYDNYADYLVEKGKYEVKKEHAMEEAKALQQRQIESQQAWAQERSQYVNERAAEAVKTIPELDGLYTENQDIIEGYSDHIKLAFLEAEKPEMAFYALASEGGLEKLEDLSPMGVAREVALAEIRGEKLAKQRPTSKAPAPIKKAKGTGTKRKSLADMKPSELINYAKNNK